MKKVEKKIEVFRRMVFRRYKNKKNRLEFERDGIVSEQKQVEQRTIKAR